MDQWLRAGLGNEKLRPIVQQWMQRLQDEKTVSSTLEKSPYMQDKVRQMCSTYEQRQLEGQTQRGLGKKASAKQCAYKALSGGRLDVKLV